MKCSLKGMLNSVRVVILLLGTAVFMIAAGAGAATVYQIGCGNTSAVSPFAADQYYSGGTASTKTGTVNTSGVSNPAPQAVLLAERYGTCSYTFPNLTANAQYTVRLHFVELYFTSSGSRVFNVVVNGTTVLTNFDIYATAGSNFKAVVREFQATANTSGQIVIIFNTVTNNATVEGIEIFSNSAPTVNTAAAVNPNPVTGTTATLSVLGADDGGESNLTYTWATTGTPPASVSFSANGTNAAKNCIATFTKAGSYTLAATIKDQGNLTVTSPVTFTVNQTLTSVTVSPSSATVGAGATQQFTAAGKDQFGTDLTSQPTFTWTVSGGGTIDANSGLFTAGSTAGGPYTVTATSGGKSGTVQVTVTAPPNNSPTVATVAAASPSSVTGTTTSLSVLGADDGGESNLTYTWATTGTPPATVTFSVNGTNAAKNCTATFAKAGSYTLTATIKDQGNLTVASSVTVTVNQTLTGVSVSPATASVGAGGATQQFTASGLDQFGTSLSSQPTFTWTVSGGGSINSSGLFSAGNTSGGPYTLTATGGGKSGTSQVTVPANTAPTVATAAAVSSNPVTGTTASLSVLGADNAGEANLAYTWATTGTPPAAVTFSANETNAAKNCIATFTKAGTYAIRATVVDVPGLSVTSDVTVTVNQTLTSVTVAPTTATVSVGMREQFTATGKDQFNKDMSPQPTFTWTVSGGGTINSSGFFIAGSTAGGPYTLTATSGGKNGTASVTVSTNVAPTVATASAASPNPATGTTASLSVLGNDDGGESNLIYTWATTGTPPAAVTFSPNMTNAAKTCTATFTKTGTYTIRATITDGPGLSVTSDVTLLVNQALTTITVTPSTASVYPAATKQFTASGLDQFGTALRTQPTFTWTVSGGGTINSSGLFTAGSTAGGPYTVTASSGGKSGPGQVTVVTNPPPTVATAAAASPTNATGTTTVLSVLGADDGGEANLTYTWATTGTPPASVTFSAYGTNTAKNCTATFTKAGTYTIRATINDGLGLSVTSDVTVTVVQTLTSVTVTPASADIAVRATQQFTASGLDQFGTALTTQPTFTWTVSGGGTFSGNGLFTGYTAGGPYTVTATATSLDKRGTAQVTVAPTPLTYDYPQACGENENMKVDGQIKCKSLLIYNWLLSQKGEVISVPDYVFEKDYDLKPLKEISEFINKNGHLPDVPSAKELETSGVDMVQLNFILLKKIEEMTLLMIKQEEKMMKQDEKIEALEKGK